MKLENQVSSLEPSKRLKELGVKQESLFYWHKDSDWRLDYWEQLLIQQHEHYSAFTAAELGEMLPDWTETVKRMKDDWICIVRHKQKNISDHSFGKTEADARAKMLIYLIENNLINIQKSDS